MSIRQEIAELVDRAARAAQAAGELPSAVLPEPALDRPARPEHGDYASNLPLRLSRAAKANPMALAEAICKHIPVEGADRRGHGRAAGLRQHPPRRRLARRPRRLDPRGRTCIRATAPSGPARRRRSSSSAPTPPGPLHVGNGRWASIGDSLARVLAAAGYAAEKEYLVNDQFTQIDNFAATLLARYKQLFGVDAEMPENGYPGDYVIELAQEIKDEFGDKFLQRRRRARRSCAASASSA